MPFGDKKSFMADTGWLYGGNSTGDQDEDEEQDAAAIDVRDASAATGAVSSQRAYVGACHSAFH
eukprot:10682556-Prorocentrum_lima.AAC.1